MFVNENMPLCSEHDSSFTNFVVTKHHTLMNRSL